MKPLFSAAAWTSKISGTIAGWLLIPLVLATAYEVAARYIFGRPTIWAYEFGYICSGSLALLGMAYTSHLGQHTRIDLAYARMGVRGKSVVDLMTYGGILVPALLLLLPVLYDRAFESWLSMERTGQSAWNPAIWPIRAIFVLSFLLLLVQALAQGINALGSVVTGRAVELPDTPGPVLEI